MKKILGLLVALCMGIPAFASVTVSPTRIEINANKIKNNYVTTAIEIKGDTTKAVRYRAYPGYFKISDKSEMIMLDGKGDIHDISDRIRFVPSEFTVPAGKAQKVWPAPAGQSIYCQTHAHQRALQSALMAQGARSVPDGLAIRLQDVHSGCSFPAGAA